MARAQRLGSDAGHRCSRHAPVSFSFVLLSLSLSHFLVQSLIIQSTAPLATREGWSVPQIRKPILEKSKHHELSHFSIKRNARDGLLSQELAGALLVTVRAHLTSCPY